MSIQDSDAINFASAAQELMDGVGYELKSWAFSNGAIAIEFNCGSETAHITASARELKLNSHDMAGMVQAKVRNAIKASGSAS